MERRHSICLDAMTKRRRTEALSSPARWGLRVFVASIAVLPGAILVGATFPAVLRAASRPGRGIGPVASALYGLNTVGAVGGALWAGFAGILDHGVVGAGRIAAGIAAGVGALAILFGRRVRRAPEPSETPSAPVPVAPLVATAFCGFVALGLEASGVRILVFFVEGFTASFAAMLAVFLAGLALGSLAVGPALSRLRRPGIGVGALLLLAGVAALVLSREIPFAEDWMRSVRRWAYAGREIVEAQRWAALAGSTFLFLLPALLLGATFPLAIRWARGEGAQGGPREDVGRVSGRVALVNGIGAVLGPLAVLAVGRAGAQGEEAGGPLLAWTALACLAAVAGAAICVLSLRARRARLVGVAALGVAAGFGIPAALSSASPSALVSASHVLLDPAGRRDPGRRLLDVRADEVVTASVVEGEGERDLYTDDFLAAATGASTPYMRLLGHLPALAAAKDDNALVIAFGTGTTAGAIAAHSGVRRLEIAEVSRAVLALAPLFREANRDVLSDPRTVLRVDDGRDALLLHARDLDVITLEPLLPYTPAALPFYTREFYRLAKDRLAEGGVLCQWVPVHAMPLDLYVALVATFFDEFPDGSLWFFEQSSILLGRKGTAAPSPSAFLARAAEVERQLRAAGLASPEALALGYVANGRRVRKAIEESPTGPLCRRPVTDDDPFPEAYPTPRGRFVTTYLADTLGWLSRLVDPDEDLAAVPELRVATRERLPTLRIAARRALTARALEAVAEFRLATAPPGSDDAALGHQGLVEADASYSEATASAGDLDRSLRRRAVRCRRVLAMTEGRALLSVAAAAKGDPIERTTLESALSRVKAAYEREPDLDPVWTERPACAALYAEILARLTRCLEAEQVLLDAAASWPADAGVSDTLAAVHARRVGGAVPAGRPGALAVARRLELGAPCR